MCGEPELAADGSIRAVTLSTAGFLTRLEANRFIDCTASGAIVGYHGFGGFRSEKGKAQPLSLCFILGGVDTDSARVLVRNDNERSRNPVLRAALENAMAAETERICKSAPEIKGLGDARLWFQALLLTNNREEPKLNLTAFDNNGADCV